MKLGLAKDTNARSHNEDHLIEADSKISEGYEIKTENDLNKINPVLEKNSEARNPDISKTQVKS